MSRKATLHAQVESNIWMIATFWMIRTCSCWYVVNDIEKLFVVHKRAYRAERDSNEQPFVFLILFPRCHFKPITLFTMTLYEQQQQQQQRQQQQQQQQQQQRTLPFHTLHAKPRQDTAAHLLFSTANKSKSANTWILRSEKIHKTHMRFPARNKNADNWSEETQLFCEKWNRNPQVRKDTVWLVRDAIIKKCETTKIPTDNYFWSFLQKNKMIALREHKGWNCKPAVRKDTVLRRVHGAWCNRYDVDKENNDCYIQWFFVTIKKLMIAPCRLTTWTWKVKLQTPGQKRHSSSAKSAWCVAQSWRNVTQNKKSKLLHTIVFCLLCLLSPWLHHHKNRH